MSAPSSSLIRKLVGHLLHDWKARDTAIMWLRHHPEDVPILMGLKKVNGAMFRSRLEKLVKNGYV